MHIVMTEMMRTGSTYIFRLSTPYVNTCCRAGCVKHRQGGGGPKIKRKLQTSLCNELNRSTFQLVHILPTSLPPPYQASIPGSAASNCCWCCLWSFLGYLSQAMNNRNLGDKEMLQDASCKEIVPALSRVEHFLPHAELLQLGQYGLAGVETGSWRVLGAESS